MPCGDGVLFGVTTISSETSALVSHIKHHAQARTENAICRIPALQ